MAASYRHTYSAEARAKFKEYASRQKIVDDATNGLTLVAEVAGQGDSGAGALIGTATLVGEEISRTYVDPACQGAGVGRALMQRLEEQARADGATEVRLYSSLNAESFYLRQGYRTFRTSSVPVANGKHLPYFRMRKHLQ